MNDDRMYHRQSGMTSPSSEENPSITTFAGLKKEANTAIIHYFAPVVALYNVVASTAGLPSVQGWHTGTAADGNRKTGKG